VAEIPTPGILLVGTWHHHWQSEIALQSVVPGDGNPPTKKESDFGFGGISKRFFCVDCGE